MRRFLSLLALIALGACASAPPPERLDWVCDNERAFSVRFERKSAEVFAAGRLYNLTQEKRGLYSDGEVSYAETEGGARLTGAFAGPYENCVSPP